MEGNASKVDLGAQLTVAHVRELHDRLGPTASAGAIVEAVASSLERVDAAGLQLLVAWSREVRAQGGAITWTPSPALLAAAETAGLARELGLSSSEHP